MLVAGDEKELSIVELKKVLDAIGTLRAAELEEVLNVFETMAFEVPVVLGESGVPELVVGMLTGTLSPLGW